MVINIFIQDYCQLRQFLQTGCYKLVYTRCKHSDWFPRV